jgi:hypothetical protein
MKVINELFEKKNIGQLILLILFIIYLMYGYSLPLPLANFINSTLGRFVVVFITLFLVFSCNPILGVASIFVAYELVKRAMNYYNTSYQQGLNSLAQYNPKEKVIQSPFNSNNQFIPFTLEQEIVQKLTPLCNYENNLEPPTYSPLVEKLSDSFETLSS